MKEIDLFELAEDILANPDLAEKWEMGEVDLGDMFATAYTLGNEEILVIFQNHLSGEIENVEICEDEEEATEAIISHQINNQEDADYYRTED